MLKNQAKKKSAGSSKGSSVKSVSSAESGSASNSPQSKYIAAVKSHKIFKHLKKSPQVL